MSPASAEQPRKIEPVETLATDEVDELGETLAEVVVLPGIETQADREIREVREQEEITAIKSGFEAMQSHELVKQQDEIIAGERSAQPERPPLTRAGKVVATAEALAKRIGRVFAPSRFDEIKSSVIGLNLYKKEKVTETELADGTELRPGDAYARLHLTLERAKPGRAEVEEDWKWVLDELARRVAEDPRYSDIEAVQCVSHLFGNEPNAEVFKEVGFEIRPVGNPVQRAFHSVMDRFEYLLARGPRAALRKEMNVKEGWISRAGLLKYRAEHPIV